MKHDNKCELMNGEPKCGCDPNRYIDKINRIERTLAQFIAWSARELGENGVGQLYGMLNLDAQRCNPDTGECPPVGDLPSSLTGERWICDVLPDENSIQEILDDYSIVNRNSQCSTLALAAFIAQELGAWFDSAKTEGMKKKE